MRKLLLLFLLGLVHFYSYSQILYDDDPLVGDSMGVTTQIEKKWYIDTLNYYFDNTSNHLTPSECERAIVNALNTWSKSSPFTFIQVYNPRLAQIRVSWGIRNYNDLARAGFTLSFGRLNTVTSCFNDAYRWNVDGSDFDLETVALHEIGHSLGLGHSDDPSSVMYRAYNGVKRELSVNDYIELSKIYGYIISISNVNCQFDTYCVKNKYIDYFDVSWSVDNPSFNISTSNKECTVTCTSGKPDETAVLTAVVSYKGEVISELTKRIVYHGSEFTAELWQYEYITPDGICPEKHLYLENGCSYLEETEDEEYVGDEDIDEDTDGEDIDYKDEEEPTDENSTLVVSVPITGGADIRLKSNWFDGMNITFSGSYAPISSVRKGLNEVHFKMPYTGVSYYAFLNAESPGGCNNFTIRFLVEQIPYGVSGDEAIRVEFLGNQLQIMLDGLEYEEIGDEAMVMPEWNLAIYDVKRDVLHDYGTIRGELTSINLSGYPNGTYVIRAGYKDHTYSKKFTLRR